MASPGRPAFVPTAAHRRQVEELLSVGTSADIVARAIGITEPTLRKHFAEELANGMAKRRAEVMNLLFKSARKGNVAAQKHLEQMTARAAAEAAFTGADEAPAAVKRGKKEQAADAALSAGEGSDWGDDLRPGVRVN